MKKTGEEVGRSIPEGMGLSEKLECQVISGGQARSDDQPPVQNLHLLQSPVSGRGVFNTSTHPCWDVST